VLKGAAFDGQGIDDQQAKQLLAQGQALLSQAHMLAA
jgi:hypothetical protein